jgi:hypothetical protein
MPEINRRDFVKMGGLAGFAGMLDTRVFSSEPSKTSSLNRMQKTVKFTRDGIDLSPLEYSRLLIELAEAGKIEADNYSRGGTVEFCLPMMPSGSKKCQMGRMFSSFMSRELTCKNSDIICDRRISKSHCQQRGRVDFL